MQEEQKNIRLLLSSGNIVVLVGGVALRVQWNARVERPRLVLAVESQLAAKRFDDAAVERQSTLGLRQSAVMAGRSLGNFWRLLVCAATTCALPILRRYR